MLNLSVSFIWILFGILVKYKVYEKIFLCNVMFYYWFQFGCGLFIVEGEYNFCEIIFRLIVEMFYDGIVKFSGFFEIFFDVSNIEIDFVLVRLLNMNMLVKFIKDINLFVF